MRPTAGLGHPGFIRGIEVQVLVNLDKADNYTSHGDLFSIWGADCVPDRPHPKGWKRCLPSERRCKGANEWNHYRVEANDGRIKLAVNGKVVSGVSKCNPRKGYLALEAEGSECQFRNLKIKELPSTNPKPNEIADEAHDGNGYSPALTWPAGKTTRAITGTGSPRTASSLTTARARPRRDLWTAKEYGDFVLMGDWRLPAKPTMKKRPVILPSGEESKEDGKQKMEVPTPATAASICAAPARARSTSGAGPSAPARSTAIAPTRRAGRGAGRRHAEGESGQTPRPVEPLPHHHEGRPADG